jgi:hypothetical protein
MPYISQEVISYVEQQRLWRRVLLDHHPHHHPVLLLREQRLRQRQ